MKQLLYFLLCFVLPCFTYAQNVGIGTAVPQTQLHINNTAGNSIIRTEANGTATQAALELKTGDAPFDFLELRKWIAGSGGTQAGISLNGLSTLTTGFNSTAGLLMGTKRAHPLYFTTDNVVRMHINEAGNVGIGTISPTAKLDVNGGMKIQGINTLEFGAGLTKEINAGKIGYQTFTGDALDIVGAGTSALNRKVNIFAEGGTTFNGPLGINGDPGNYRFRVESGDKGSLFIENPVVTANATVRILRGVPASSESSTTALWVEASGDYASRMRGLGGIYAISTSSLRPAAHFEANTTGYALETVGKISLTGTGAAAGSVLELNNGYIKVSGTNKSAFVHTTNTGNINNNYSTLNYSNAAATDMLFVTHNYSPINTYFNYNYGVYWSSTAWNIYIETPATPMPVNINFNVMVIKQ